MGRSSKALALTTVMSVILVNTCISLDAARAVEIISLHETGSAIRAAPRAAAEPHVERRRQTRTFPGSPLGRRSRTDLAYAGLDGDGPFGGFFDGAGTLSTLSVVPPPPQPPLLPPPPLPPFAGLPPQPPACPLIIEVGRGLRHAVRTHVISGHSFCR